MVEIVIGIDCQITTDYFSSDNRLKAKSKVFCSPDQIMQEINTNEALAIINRVGNKEETCCLTFEHRVRGGRIYEDFIQNIREHNINTNYLAEMYTHGSIEIPYEFGLQAKLNEINTEYAKAYYSNDYNKLAIRTLQMPREMRGPNSLEIVEILEKLYGYSLEKITGVKKDKIVVQNINELLEGYLFKDLLTRSLRKNIGNTQPIRDFVGNDFIYVIPSELCNDNGIMDKIYNCVIEASLGYDVVYEFSLFTFKKQEIRKVYEI